MQCFTTRLKHLSNLTFLFCEILLLFSRLWYQLEENLSDNQQKLSAARFSQIYSELSTEELPTYDPYLDTLVALFQCNSLHLNLDKFCLSTVLQCLNRWLELDSLRITFKEGDESAVLHAEEHRTLDEHSRYKITKLSIEQFLAFDQIVSLIKVCLDLSHFQLKCRNIDDIEWLIRYVSTEQKSSRFRHLHFLCIWFPLADENTMKILQDCMNTDRLLDNHTIKRIGERIYVEWGKETVVDGEN